MAKTSVSRGKVERETALKLVDDRLWIKAQWEELNIPSNVRSRLANIDTATYICSNLATLLVNDEILRTNADDEAGAVYRPLRDDQRNSLLLAMQHLLWDSMEMGDCVRNNTDNCWGAQA